MKAENSFRPNLATNAVATLTIFVLAICATAQPENFRSGDTVVTNDGRVCKVLTVTGRSARVACGASRSEIRVYSFDSITSEARAAARREELERQRTNGSNRPRPTTVTFNVGDTVQMRNGKIGKIESLTGEVAQVKVGTESDYVVVQDLKKIETEPQRSFRVGDSVVANGQAGVVEELTSDGKGAKVRFGNGKYDFKWVPFVNMKSPAEGRAAAEQEKMAKTFSVEAKPYFESVGWVLQYYDPKAMDLKGSKLHGEDRKKVASDLAELDRICTTKYPNIENEKMANPNAEVPLHLRYGDQCAIARNRDEILKKAKARVLALSTEGEIANWSNKLNRLRGGNGYLVGDDVQMLIYDRAAWEQKTAANIRKEYSVEAETMPVDAFAPLYKIADEVKAKIAADVETRSWKQPKYSDAAFEALGRRELAGDFPGATVSRIGMTYTTWEVRDESTFVGSDSVWRYYRITPGAYRYKNGELLAQLPNRPFCQVREFTVTQRKAGGGYGAAKAYGSTAGTFVKCP